jgi:hypothetical protein
MRVVLPALAFLRLDYVGEFSEDLISRIDAPRLNKLVSVAFCGRDGLPQLQNFIGRTQKLKPFDRATMEFRSQKICMALGYLDPSTVFESEVIFQSPDWQLSPMMQIFSQHLSLLSHVEELEMCDDSPSAALRWKIYSDLNPSQWLLLFHLLIGVKRLRVSKRLIPLVESALQELVGGRTMAVLPALRRLALEGLQPSEPAPEGIASFIAARELSGHPVVILDWVSDEDAE